MTPRIIGSLHDGACKSAEECVCTPVFLLESVERPFDSWDNVPVRVRDDSESNKLRDGVHDGTHPTVVGASRVRRVSP